MKEERKGQLLFHLNIFHLTKQENQCVLLKKQSLNVCELTNQFKSRRLFEVFLFLWIM